MLPPARRLFMKANIRLQLFILALFFVAIGAKADTLGQSQNFFISTQYDAQGRTNITATLKQISDRAYFYIENNYWNALSQAAQDLIISQINGLAREFDSRIYPTETQFFGPEPNPGIDDDPRITIVLSPLVENAGGYFDTSNEYPRSQSPNSNQREMIYVNVASLNEPRRIDSFIAHEFQHLISFNQKETLRHIADDTWLNELRSQYAVTLLGYNDNFSGSDLERREHSLLDNPSDSLTEWKNLSADYGQITLFGEYLAEHWSAKVIGDTLRNNLASIASLNDSLRQNGYKESFADVFVLWTVTNFINDPTANPQFAYSRDGLRDLRVPASRVLSNLGDDVSYAVSDSIKDWQARRYDISQFAVGQNGVLRIKFSSPSLTSFTVPYIVFKSDGSKTLIPFKPDYNADTLYIDGVGGNIARVVLLPFKNDKIGGFTADEPAVPLTFVIDRVKSVPQAVIVPTPSPIAYGGYAPTPTINPAATVSPSTQPIVPIVDGSLVRAMGDGKVYLIRGQWKRHIINSRIFKLNGWSFNQVREVPQSLLDQYQNSKLIRYQGGKRVYETDIHGQRHWLNISGESFTASRRNWTAIFPVSLHELYFYQLGSSITK